MGPLGSMFLKSIKDLKYNGGVGWRDDMGCKKSFINKKLRQHASWKSLYD